MALTPQVRVGQARALALVTEPTEEIQVTQARALAMINFPTPFMHVSQARAEVAVNATKPMLVSQARVMVAARGRVANPRVRAWTFTLDGHDFYVLRLGDTETLVYDTYSKQWMDWDGEDLSFWRTNTGITWPGGAALAYEYGSNVVAGDDTWGLLWFLDPELGYDQHPDADNTNQELAFERVVMGQYPKRGYNAEPCYVIYLDAALGSPTVTAPYLKLETSDDAGHTFIDQGSLVTTVGDYTQVLSWQSLGQIAQPGRLFRITDNGATPAIFDMEMNDDAG